MTRETIRAARLEDAPEIAGEQLIRTQPITIGGALLEEVAYGWRDIRSLLM